MIDKFKKAINNASDYDDQEYPTLIPDIDKAAESCSKLAQEYSDSQTAALQNRVKELEGELEKQKELTDQWFTMFNNQVKNL